MNKLRSLTIKCSLASNCKALVLEICKVARLVRDLSMGFIDPLKNLFVFDWIKSQKKKKLFRNNSTEKHIMNVILPPPNIR